MIVITGGSGFIGSHLCSHLAEQGHELRIADLVPAPLGVPGEFVRASVLDAGRLAKLFAGAEGVVHLAALVDVQASVADPFVDFQVNAGGTVNVLEAARRAGVKRVVFASSAAVYGNPRTVPVKESHPALPLSPYGASKLAAERHVILYNSLYGMENVALRLFNVYGRGQSPSSPYSGVITKFCGCVRAGRRPIIYGDGEQTRDFVHVDDVANALARSLGRGGYPTPINIASGKEVSVKSLLKTCCAIADVPADAKCLPERPGEIERSVADISLARRVLGYSPKIALEQGIRELLEQ